MKTKGLLIGILILVMVSGCVGTDGYTPSGTVVNTTDSAIRDDDVEGLDLEVVGFKWRYIESSKQLEVRGKARNNMATHLQGTRIFAKFYDQFDKPVGRPAQAFVEPTVLAPGQEGEFQLYVNGGHYVKALRLAYNFDSRSESGF